MNEPTPEPSRHGRLLRAIAWVLFALVAYAFFSSRIFSIFDKILVAVLVILFYCNQLPPEARGRGL
jgi:hypothetical protein